MRLVLVLTLSLLSACSWFGWRKHPTPPATEIYVTGAPLGSIVFVDGAQVGQEVTIKDHPQILTVTAGVHQVEVHVGERIVYREDAYVPVGEHRVITVLSGLNRQ